jgi:hypothetical protein
MSMWINRLLIDVGASHLHEACKSLSISSLHRGVLPFSFKCRLSSPHKVWSGVQQFARIEITEIQLLLHLCAWGNDAVNEVKPRRVNCWLKTISNPPAVPARVPQNFCKVRPRLGPHNSKPNSHVSMLRIVSPGEDLASWTSNQLCHELNLQCCCERLQEVPKHDTC